MKINCGRLCFQSMETHAPPQMYVFSIQFVTHPPDDHDACRSYANTSSTLLKRRSTNAGCFTFSPTYVSTLGSGGSGSARTGVKSVNTGTLSRLASFSNLNGRLWKTPRRPTQSV